MIKDILEFMGWKTEREGWCWVEISIDFGMLIIGTLLVTGGVYYG